MEDHIKHNLKCIEERWMNIQYELKQMHALIEILKINLTKTEEK